jgi:tRNA threonylcarbamoyladenosine biosynthesis protein TsaB
MKFLSLETSTKYSVIAVCDEKGLIFGERRLFEKGRVDAMPELCREALKKAKLPLEKIDGFGIGIGPGSFTGLRIGLSTVQALSYAMGKPCYPFSSLDAIAANLVDEETERLCVVVDAKRSHVYACSYEKGKIRRSADELISVDALKDRCPRGTVFCGDACGLYRSLLEDKKNLFRVLPENLWFPTPQSIAFLTREAYRENKSKNCFELRAAYLYEQDCQVKRA